MQRTERLEHLRAALELLEQNRIMPALSLLREGLFESEAHPAPDEQELIRTLGVACHRRMLERSETDPEGAIGLAEAGARLYRRLQEEAPEQPGWVPIHEEQFCRYGAIWIHQQLSSQPPGTGPELFEQRRQLGLALLARLTAFYPEPTHWVPVIRQSLEKLAPSPPPPGPPLIRQATIRIALVGNCQTHPLFLGLSQALPDHSIHFCTPVHMATPADVAELHRVLADTDLLVMHRILPGYRDDIGLDGPTLRALLPAHGRQLVLPNLHYEGYHPLIGYAHLSEEPTEPSPLGDYHDFLAMVAAAHGLSASDLLAWPLHPEIAERLQAWHHQSLDQLRQREKDCDLRLSPWIEAHTRHFPLFHTFNHPSNWLLEQMLAALLEQIAPDLSTPTPSLGSHEHLGQHNHGVLPWVRQALGLEAWALEAGRQEWNVPWSLEQQLNQSIGFYSRHPWIGLSNQASEKYRLAIDLIQLGLSSLSD